MGSTPIDVFLTYDERDADLAADVRRAVTAAGLSCWAEHVDLVPGQLWDEVIPARLSAARVMAVLITPQWPEAGQKNTDWYGPEKVALAIDQARGQGGRPMIVPVRMRGASRDRVPFGIRRAAQLELAEDNLGRLAAELKRAVATQAGQPAPAATETIVGVERDAARARRAGDAGERADVVIVTALKVELDALIEQSGVEWTPGTDRERFPYYAAELDGLRVVAARTGGLGERDATERAVRLHDEFRPRVLAICGICAGHPDETHLGDVVIASRVFNFEHGLRRPDGTVAPDVQTYELNRPWKVITEDLAAETDTWLGALSDARPPTLRWLAEHALWRLHDEGVVERFPGEDRAVRNAVWDRLVSGGLVEGRRPRYSLTDAGVARAEELEWDGGPEPDPPLRARLGVMATGSAVHRDPKVWDRIQALQRKALAVEMESTAIGAVATQQKLEFLAVKGVSDHANADKDDRFHAFAARASAAFLLAFLRRHVEPRLRAASWTPPQAGDTAPRSSEQPASVAPAPAEASADRWVEPAEFEQIVSAYIQYPLSRDLLLSWINHTIVSRLKSKDTPAEQVRADLTTLNSLPATALGDDPPLVKWLEQAVRLAGPFPQARSYQRILDTLRARIARR